MAVWRRYGRHLPRFRRSLTDDALVLGMLLALGLTGFLLEALRLAATHDPAASIHWVAYPLALALWGVDPAVLEGAHTVTWWFHMLCTTALVAYIPVSKLFHMFTAPANVFARATEPAYALAGIDRIEEQEHFGADKLADFNWKQLVGTDACMRCGRCLDYCPTFVTGKPLKPRQLVIEISAALDREAGLLGGVAGPLPSDAGVRGNDLTETPQPNAAELPVAARLIGDVVSQDEIWDCTTCRACMEQCPVLIEHVPLITELRRNLVLEQSSFPQELQTLFNNLERNGNPYSFPASTRADWAQSLGRPAAGRGRGSEPPRGAVLGRLHGVVRRAESARRNRAGQGASRRRASRSPSSGSKKAVAATRPGALVTSTCTSCWPSRTSRRFAATGQNASSPAARIASTPCGTSIRSSTAASRWSRTASSSRS